MFSTSISQKGRRLARTVWLGIALASLFVDWTGLPVLLAAQPPANLQVGMRQRGQASYYADKFHGRLTASGERFDMYALTAAHKTLPFGTVISVTNLRNGRVVRVRINDRGPFVAGRIVDVSKKAARVLGMEGAGIVPAEITILRLVRLPASESVQTERKTQSGAKIPSSKPTRFAIQIASYAQHKYAQRLRQQLVGIGMPVRLERSGRYQRLVLVDLSWPQVQYYQKELARLGFSQVLVRQER